MKGELHQANAPFFKYFFNAPVYAFDVNVSNFVHCPF